MSRLMAPFFIFALMSATSCKIVEYPYYISESIYSIDLVFCIDISGSMGGQLGQIKNNIISLYEELEGMMLEDEKYITRLRAKFVLFSDIYVDGSEALTESDMYELPLEKTELSTYVSGISLLGGGDAPESGLEALSMALKSDWLEGSINKRNVIIVCSDAPALPLTPSLWPSSVPAGLHRSFEELTAAWEEDERNPIGKRLILFTPEFEPWTTIADQWRDVFIYPEQATVFDFKAVLDVIVGDL